MKLVTWNVRNGGRPAPQADRLSKIEPDVIALQEIQTSTAGPWADSLERYGYIVETTADLIGEQRYGVLVASKWPIERLPTRGVEVPYPARFMSALVSPATVPPFELHCTHVPDGSGHGWRKVEHFEGLYRHLVRPSERSRILCGDFNSPRAEWPDSTVVTWAEEEDGHKLRRDRGQRWDAAERSILLGLEPFGLRDAFRECHGYGRADSEDQKSWFTRDGRGRRFDHVLAPPHWAVEHAEYLHEWRRQGLSDHAPLLVCLQPA